MNSRPLPDMSRTISRLGLIRHASTTPVLPPTKPITKKIKKEPRDTLGENIYAFNHLRTKQVVYSLRPVLKPTDALKQLPYNGKKTIPSHLRKDLWQPLAHISISRGPHSTKLGIVTMQKLREYRKMHELQWDPEEMRGLTKLSRGKRLMDQKANSVADMAAAIERAIPAEVREIMGGKGRWSASDETKEDKTSESKQENEGEVKALTAPTEASEDSKPVYTIYLANLAKLHTQKDIISILQTANLPLPTTVQRSFQKEKLIFANEADALTVWKELQGDKAQIFTTAKNTDLDVRYRSTAARYEPHRLNLFGLSRTYTKETFLADYEKLNLPTPTYIALHQGPTRSANSIGFASGKDAKDALTGLEAASRSSFDTYEKFVAKRAPTAEEKVAHYKRKVRAEWAGLRVTIKWKDLLDAEFAERWPAVVRHEVWNLEARRARAVEDGKGARDGVVEGEERRQKVVL